MAHDNAQRRRPITRGDGFDGFREWSSDVKGWAPETVRIYAGQCKQAAAWLETELEIPLARASTGDLTAWLDSAVRGHEAHATHRAALVAFYDYLAAEGLADGNPARPIPRMNPTDVTVLPQDAATELVRFRERLMAEGLADGTVDHYMRLMRRYLQWCERHNTDPVNLSAVELRDFLATIKLTRSMRMAARSSLRRWFEDHGREDSVWRAVRVPPKPRRFCKALSPGDARRLADAATMVGGRQGLAVLCLMYLAARVGEVAMLRWDGWDRARGTFSFERPKNGDVLTVPVHPVLAERLELAEQFADGGHLFVGNSGRHHVNETTVWSWVKKIAAVAGVEAHPHALRHTALTTALDATGDLRSVMELAGHADPATTAGYTRSNAKRIAAAVAALDYMTVEEDDGREVDVADLTGYVQPPSTRRGRDS